MDNLISIVASGILLSGVPFAAYNVSRFVDRLTK